MAREPTFLLAVAFGAWLGSGGVASAADHAIAAQTQTVDCSSFNPGDTVTLAAGVRGPLVVHSCSGTSTNPIVIRNDPRGSEPTTIRRAAGSSGGFVFNCNDCTGVSIDGSAKWQGAPSQKTYGIRVTMTGGGGPSAFLRIGGTSRFVTIRNVEIDGAWPQVATDGIGISVNDHKVKAVDHPGLWREGYLIEDNYVHNTEGEGMYIGPNFREGDLPLRNIEIRNNRVEDIGWEGINTKSMWSGDNSIHHNVVRRAGKNDSNSNKPTQYSGINNSGGTVKIYNNWVEDTGTHGILVWTVDGPSESSNVGPFDVKIWNNVIVDAGGLWRSFMSNSYGINVGAEAGCTKYVPTIYNNTIVNSRESAIRLTSNVGAGVVRDNIVAGSGGTPIAAPSIVRLSNNQVGTVLQMAFVDAQLLNFRLSNSSPARNKGGTDFPQTDYDGVPRPQDGAPDLGAFEGNNTQTASSRPQAPDALAVQ